MAYSCVCCLDSIFKFWLFSTPPRLKRLSLSTACFSQTVSRPIDSCLQSQDPPLLHWEGEWPWADHAIAPASQHTAPPSTQLPKSAKPSRSSCPSLFRSKSYQPNLHNSPQIHSLHSHWLSPSPSCPWLWSHCFHLAFIPSPHCRQSMPFKYANPSIVPLPPFQKSFHGSLRL